MPAAVPSLVLPRHLADSLGLVATKCFLSHTLPYGGCCYGIDSVFLKIALICYGLLVTPSNNTTRLCCRWGTWQADHLNYVTTFLFCLQLVCPSLVCILHPKYVRSLDYFVWKLKSRCLVSCLAYVLNVKGFVETTTKLSHFRWRAYKPLKSVFDASALCLTLPETAGDERKRITI